MMSCDVARRMRIDLHPTYGICHRILPVGAQAIRSRTVIMRRMSMQAHLAFLRVKSMNQTTSDPCAKAAQGSRELGYLLCFLSHVLSSAISRACSRMTSCASLRIWSSRPNLSTI